MPEEKKLSHRRLYALLHELAENELTQRVLARKYGISQARVSQLGTQYADEVEDMRADLEDEYAGLWLAQKAERVKAYMRLAEMLEEDLQVSGLESSFINQLQKVYKNIAEEMGQLPARVIVTQTGPKADYTVGGVDPRELK